MFGHVSDAQAIDCLYKEAPVTVGTDKTLRRWQIENETHLLFKGHAASIDCVAMLNDDVAVSGSQDGSLCVWSTKKKKPVSTVETAHGSDQWIGAVGAYAYTDVVATGAADGFLRIWQCHTENAAKKKSSVQSSMNGINGTNGALNNGHTDADAATAAAAANDNNNPVNARNPRKNQLTNIHSVAVDGYINGIAFAGNGRFVVAAVANEHRLGRWLPVNKRARNGIVIVDLRKHVDVGSFDSEKAGSDVVDDSDDDDDDDDDSDDDAGVTIEFDDEDDDNDDDEDDDDDDENAGEISDGDEDEKDGEIDGDDDDDDDNGDADDDDENEDEDVNDDDEDDEDDKEEEETAEAGTAGRRRATRATASSTKAKTKTKTKTKTPPRARVTRNRKA
jgi:hypothetical protein